MAVSPRLEACALALHPSKLDSGDSFFRAFGTKPALGRGQVMSPWRTSIHALFPGRWSLLPLLLSLVVGDHSASWSDSLVWLQ